MTNVLIEHITVEESTSIHWDKETNMFEQQILKSASEFTFPWIHTSEKKDDYDQNTWMYRLICIVPDCTSCKLLFLEERYHTSYLHKLRL